MTWCEIFRTGTHKDSKGNVRNWTKQDLETIKNNFHNVNPDLPVCCGHPKSNSPAYGWTDEMMIKDFPDKNISKLYASYKDVVPEFKEAYRKGLFKTRSLSLTKDLVPRHIAFLGAQSPAIKGMEQFCFESAEDDDIIINFEANEFGNETMANDDNNANGEPALAGATGDASSPDSKPKGANMPQEGQENDLEKQLAQKDEEIKALQKQVDDAKKAAMTKDFEDFCDNAIADGHITPSQRNDVLNILFACTDTSINFEDGTEKDAAEVFKGFVKNLKQMDFEDVANPAKVNKDKEINFSDAEDVKENILSIQKEYAEKGISLSAVEAYGKLKTDFR